MKPRFLMLLAAIALFVALAIPVRLAAQNKPEHNNNHQFHHYKLMDLGTFGGPTGWLCNDQTFGGGACPVLNNRGTIVSGADTTRPNPNAANPSIFLPPTGSPPGDPFIQHAFQWQGGALQDLGTLPGGYNSIASAISENGLVAGVSETGAIDPLLGVPAVDAVLWNNGKIIDLGPFEGGYESAAIAVNDRGQAVGWGLNTVPDNFWFFSTQARAFLWQNGAMQDLGALDTGTDAFAFFINEHGQVAGASFTNTTVNPVLTTCTLYQLEIPTQDPFLWENGKMTDLGTLGGTCGLPNALNNRGQVVGQSDLAGDASFHAFVWTSPGPMRDLGTLGGSSSTANWINDAGDVVGAADIPPAFHAFLWRHGVMTDLGTLGSGPCSGALGINSRRQVVGGSGDCALDLTSHAFLWENGQIIDLNIFNYPGSGLQQLMFGYNINDRGEIVGLGVPPGVNPGDVFTLGHVFVLIPCDGHHPGVEGCDYSLVGTTLLPQAPAPPAASSRSSGQPFKLPRTRFPFRNHILGRPLVESGIDGEGAAAQPQSQGPESPQAPIVMLQPASLDFGTVRYGQTKTLTTTLTNVGTTTLRISSITITGTDTADFSQTNTCGAKVRAGKSCGITATFKPLGFFQKNFSADVSVSDNANGSPQHVALSGTGEPNCNFSCSQCPARICLCHQPFGGCQPFVLKESARDLLLDPKPASACQNATQSFRLATPN